MKFTCRVMGINSLTAFIDKNPNLLHEHQLHNKAVVIDGNNFYHFIYNAFHVQSKFGGDYDTYRKSIITIFDSLKRCGITPYVVMDGGYTRDGRKLKTSLARATSRIQLVKAMIYDHRGHVLPALAYDTFLQTLSELGIPHATCQFEADAEIAVLANQLECPVISNDSDFYIFDLSNGFLPLDYIDFRPLQSGKSENLESYSYLHCRIYHVDEFITSFEGLNRTVLPIFASLLGNDFIQPSAFSAFYSNFKVPKVVSKKFSLPPKLAKVISVLHWLNSCVENQDISAIKDQIVSFINPQKKSTVEKLLISSVHGYTQISNFNGYDLLKYFTRCSEEWHTCPDPDFSLYNGAPFPGWFLKSVCRGEIAPSILNASVLHRVIIPTQVEDLKSQPSYSCSANLRRVLYAILIKDDPPVTHPRRTNDVIVSDPVDIVESESSSHRAYTDGVCNLNQDFDVDKDRLGQDERATVSEPLLGCLSVAENLLPPCTIPADNNDEEDADIVDESGTNDGLVIEEDDADSGIISPQLRELCVEEYNRADGNLKKFCITPVDKIGECSVPGLNKMSTMLPELRKSILISALQVDLKFLENFTQSMQMFMACVIYWVSHADPKVTITHLECVLVSSIFLKLLTYLKDKKHLIINKTQDSNSVNDSTDKPKQENSNNHLLIDIDQICKESNIEILKKVKHNMEKYHKKSPVFNHKNHFDPEIIHGFAQLQACLLDTINLNKVLLFPIPNLRPSELINGTFLYNLYVDLKSRAEPDLFLAAMFNNNKELYNLFQTLKFLVVNTVELKFFKDQSAVKRKTRNRKYRSKKQKNTSAVAVYSSDSDDKSGVATVAGFEINNRFNLLCLDS